MATPTERPTSSRPGTPTTSGPATTHTSTTTPELAQASVEGDDPETLKAEAENLDALAERGYFNERLDQIVVEVLLGVR